MRLPADFKPRASWSNASSAIAGMGMVIDDIITGVEKLHSEHSCMLWQPGAHLWIFDET